MTRWRQIVSCVIGNGEPVLRMSPGWMRKQKFKPAQLSGIRRWTKQIAKRFVVTRREKARTA